MSLFGGDDSVVPSSAEDDLTVSPIPDDLSRDSTPPNAQHPPLVSFTLDSDEHDDELNDELDDDSKEESEEEPSRPNRFKGPPPTWRRYTVADRQIAASLEDIESADLAAHLYNAHNLKRRVRRPAEQLAKVKDWQSKGSWLKDEEDLQFEAPSGDMEAELIPLRSWTAWPLPPKELPARNETLRQPNIDEDSWYIGRSETQDAGESLREEMLAVALRLGNEKWSSREMNKIQPMRKPGANIKRRGVSSDGSQSAAPESEDIATDAEMEDAESTPSASEPSKSEPEEKFASIIGKKRSRKRQLPSVQPAFLADDDTAQRILQPSINSVLARLDNLALAVRRSRLNHFGRGAYSDRSASEFTSEAESVGVAPLAQSQVSSKSNRHRRMSTQPSSRASNKLSHEQKAPKRKSRPQSDDDSVSDYAADLQDRMLEGSSSYESRPKSRRNSNSSSLRNKSRQHGLMDWSEVLGIASVTGWDERVIARTAQRCAVLFGENMFFRTFDEGLATHLAANAEIVQYIPSIIPDPSELGTNLPSEARKRPLFEKGTTRCPHKDCWGSQKDFPGTSRVVEHCRRVHGYDPRTNDSDNEERKVGGVHIDGFLQPVTAKHGWLGGGRSKSGEVKSGKRRKKLKRDNVPTSPFALEGFEGRTSDSEG